MASKAAQSAAIQTVAPAEVVGADISYSVSEDKLRETWARFKTITFDTREGYEEGRLAIAECVATRTAIKDRHKFLKADSLARCQKIDARKRELLAFVEEEFEADLRKKKEAVDNAKEIARRAAEDAEREAIRLAEQAKLEEQRAELARIEEAQRVASEAEAARQAEESQRLAAQSAELARQAEVQAEERAAFQREREAFESQRRAAVSLVPEVPPAPVTQEAVDAAIASEITGTLPPVSGDWVSAPAVAEAEILRDFARQIRALKAPAVKSDTAALLVEQVESILAEAAGYLESFEEAATAAE